MDNEVTENKSNLLKAIEFVIAKPENIKKEATQLLDEFKKSNPKKSTPEIQKLVSKKIISNYSYYAGFSGGTTALSGVVPGIGTAVAIGGGASADLIACMKFQIEMTMALATVYGHDILNEEEKRLCYMIAGLGAINKSAQEGGKTVSSKAFVKLVNTHLKGAALTTVKEIFKKVGITFTRKALVKAIPFGVGVIVGFAANKGLTLYVGSKARDFFIDEAE